MKSLFILEAFGFNQDFKCIISSCLMWKKWSGMTTEVKRIQSHISVGLTPVFKSVVTTFFPGSP